MMQEADDTLTEVVPRRRAAAVAAVAAATAMVVYANSLLNGFALDDEAIVATNPIVHHVAGLRDAWSSVYWPNTSGRIGLYRPLTIASYVVDWAVWRGHPFGFHLTNVALHGVVTALVVVLVLRLGAPVSAALAGGLIFAVHPVHVEAVAGVVGRAEELVTALVLVACLIHLRRTGSRWLRWIATAACFLAALLAKEIAIALPALLVIVDWLDPRRRETVGARLRAEAPLYVLLAAAFAAYLTMRYAVLGVFGGSNVAAGLESATAGVRTATSARIWLDYVRLMIYPRDLIADYSPNVRVPMRWSQLLPWLGALIVVLICWSAWAARRRAQWWTAAVAWFAASVFIVSNFVVPVGIVLAERNLYLASAALAFGIVPLAATLRGHTRVGGGMVAVVVIAFAARTWTRTPVWRSTASLLSQLAASHPEAFRAQTYLADVAMHHAQPAQAVPHYARAWAMVPNPVIGESYALALLDTRDWTDAERVAGQSCSVEYPSPCLYLIDALMAERKPEQARLVVDSIAPHVAPSLALANRELAVARAVGDTGDVRSTQALIARLESQPH